MTFITQFILFVEAAPIPEQTRPLHRCHEHLLEAVERLELVVAVAIGVVDADGHVLGDAGADGGADEEARQAQVQLVQRVAPRSPHAALVRLEMTHLEMTRIFDSTPDIEYGQIWSQGNSRVDPTKAQ